MTCENMGPDIYFTDRQAYKNIKLYTNVEQKKTKVHRKRVSR